MQVLNVKQTQTVSGGVPVTAAAVALISGYLVVDCVKSGALLNATVFGGVACGLVLCA